MLEFNRLLLAIGRAIDTLSTTDPVVIVTTGHWLVHLPAVIVTDSYDSCVGATIVPRPG